MATLTSAARRALRAKAHHLQPVVAIGANGLTRAVLHEIDVNLIAHELVKIRVFDADRDAREELLTHVCAELGAAPVQHLGKTLTLWRAAPAAQTAAASAKASAARSSGSRRRAVRRSSTA